MSSFKSVVVFMILMVGLGTQPLWAHATGENYSFLDIRENSIEGHFEINLVNLKNDLKLSIDDENTLASLEQTAPIVQQHILENYAIFSATGGGEEKLTIQFTTVELFGEDRQKFAKYFFNVAVDPMPNELVFQNTLFFDNNKQHRGLLLVEYNHKTQKNYGGENVALIFSPDNDRQSLDLNEIPQLLKRKDFIWQGVLHILIGYDHILFLIALLLTAVVRREDGQWKREESFRTVLFNFVTTVTLFTVAHSITLTLAALGFIKIHPPLVESIIALSIILVALNNIFPWFNERKWLLILIFGLFHGLGFATVMAQLPFRMVDLVYVMLYFNIGVELGQLAIVAVLLPVLFYLSRYEKRYLKFILMSGSIVIGLIASYWFVERALLG